MDDRTIEAVKNSRLMTGIDDVRKLLSCFYARVRKFTGGEEIAGYGAAAEIVILTQGRATVVSEDFPGNRNIISRLSKSGIFGAAFVYSGHEVISRLVADTDGEAVILSGERLHAPCENACVDHTRFLYNAVRVISQSCVGFLEKVEHLSRRTTREKVMSYLTAQSMKAGSKDIAIPFSRQELADYLAVDRSALSAELGRMQKDGLITFKMNRFHLK